MKKPYTVAGRPPMTKPTAQYCAKKPMPGSIATGSLTCSAESSSDATAPSGTIRPTSSRMRSAWLTASRASPSARTMASSRPPGIVGRWRRPPPRMVSKAHRDPLTPTSLVAVYPGTVPAAPEGTCVEGATSPRASPHYAAPLWGGRRIRSPRFSACVTTWTCWRTPKRLTT